VAEAEVLSSLLAELDLNRRVVDQAVQALESLETSALVLLSPEAQDPSEIPADSVDGLIADLGTAVRGGWVRATLDALIASDMSLIENRATRARIAAWSRALDGSRTAEEFHNEIVFRRVLPYWEQNVNMAQLSNRASLPRSETDMPYAELPVGPATPQHRRLLADPTFRNVVVEVYWSTFDQRSSYEALRRQLDGFAAALAAQLGS